MANSAYQHRLELRASKLAKGINRRIDTLHQALQPPGARPPFTTQMSSRKAMEWWLQNIDNPATGGRVLSAMDPVSQLELRNALSDYIRTLMPGGAPNAPQQ